LVLGAACWVLVPCVWCWCWVPGAGGGALLTIFGERSWRFPDRDADDRHAGFAGLIEDQFGNAFHSGVAVNDENRFAKLFERGDKRIIVPQNHFVIQLAIDPPFDNTLDIAEVADHIAIIERAGPDLDFRDGVVAVRMFANAVVIEQTVAVTEVDAFGYRVHLLIWSSGNLVIYLFNSNDQMLDDQMNK
jgi:hypothetical protein